MGMSILRKVEKLIDILGGISLALIVVLTSSNIITNWVAHMRYPEIDDLVNTLFVCVTYLGTGVLYKNGDQISVDFLVDSMPPRVQKAVNLFVDVVCLLISSIMAKLAWDLCMKSQHLSTPSLKIPYFIVDIPLVVGFATMAVYIVAKLVYQVMKRTGGQNND